MKKYIISKLRERGLNSKGEENVMYYFYIAEIVLKIVMIPFIIGGIMALGFLMSLLFELILNF